MVPMTSLASPNYQLGLEVYSALRQMKIKHVRYGLFLVNHQLLKDSINQMFNSQRLDYSVLTTNRLFSIKLGFFQKFV